MIRLLLLGNTILFVEHFNTSACLGSFLLAGKEGMALGADLDVDLLLCGANHKLVTTVTGYFCLIVGRLYVFSHFFHLMFLRKTFNSSNVIDNLEYVITRFHKVQHFFRLLSRNIPNPAMIRAADPARIRNPCVPEMSEVLGTPGGTSGFGMRGSVTDWALSWRSS